MRFTIRAGSSSASAGGFAIAAADAREALDHVRRLGERGLENVHVIGEGGQRYDLIELERATAQGEAAGS